MSSIRIGVKMRLYENRRDEAPRNFRPQLHRAGFLGLFAHPRLPDLAEQIVGPEVLLHPTYTARPELPGHEPTEVPWHQDATPSTLPPRKGHLIRSSAHPERIVRDAQHWAQLKFQ